MAAGLACSQGVLKAPLYLSAQDSSQGEGLTWLCVPGPPGGIELIKGCVKSLFVKCSENSVPLHVTSPDISMLSQMLRTIREKQTHLVWLTLDFTGISPYRLVAFVR